MFGAKSCSRRSARFVQLHAGKHPTTSAQEIEGNGNHRVRLHFEHRIEKFAVAGIFPDFVLEERLLAGEYHTNDARVQRLFEFTDQLVSVRAGIPGRDKKFGSLIEEP